MILPIPIIISEIEFMISDSPYKKTVQVFIKGCSKGLTLWSGASYDAIGDYTQEQVDMRVLELLGDNPSQKIKDLYS